MVSPEKWTGTLLAEGTPICLGFDGSDSNDWTAIRAETFEGFQFTPAVDLTGDEDYRVTIWNPAEHGGRIPRADVVLAVAWLFTRYKVRRMYCDPHDWTTQIEDWVLAHGSDHVIEWDTGRGTSRLTQMHEALARFVTDLTTGRVSHDGCPLTGAHMANARKLARPGERYILGKPAEHQKIDAAMASVLAHEAACDSRADDWGNDLEPATVYVWR